MLTEYIGQRDALAPLIAAIEASRVTGRNLPHSLFLGKPGTGKTTLARAVAAEMGGPCIVINCASVTEKEQIGEAAIKAQGGTLFLDEVHALDRKQSESLFTLLDEGTVSVQVPVIGQGWHYEWMETAEDYAATGAPGHWYGASLYSVPVDVETRQTEQQDIIVGSVTVIGATTDEAFLPPALLSRLSRLVVRLRPYEIDELATIAANHAEALDCSMDGEAAVMVAQRARQSPRRVKQLTERSSDYALTRDAAVITVEDVESALAAAGVDENGLEAPHREMLRVLVDSGGVSRTSLAQRMGIPARNIDLYWGDLTERGFVTIGRRHEATEAGRAVVA